MSQDTCLIQKLQHYAPLDADSKGKLAELEKETRSFEPGAVIIEKGSRSEMMYVVQSGWAYHYVLLSDGRRQIVKIHHPGDVIGFPDIAYDKSNSTLQACANDLVLCPFPKAEFGGLFVRYPRLSALLFAIAVRDQVLFSDLITATGRMSARERLCYLLLEMRARLRITDTIKGNSFALPLTQTEIGDTLGMTNVYVSKTLKLMEDQDLIARSGARVTLKDLRQMADLCEFHDRHETLDTSWLPAKVGLD